MADEKTTVEEAPRMKPRFRARLRYARIAPRKLRPVADLIRGKDYNSAIAILRACPRRGAVFCRKVLDSALANATSIIGAPERLRKKREEYPAEVLREIDVDDLHVVEIRVDPGIIMKRWRPSSMRRPQMIRKRFSHLEIILQEQERKLTKKERKAQRRRKKKDAAKKPAEPKPAEKPDEKAPEVEAKKAEPKKKKTVRKKTEAVKKKKTVRKKTEEKKKDEGKKKKTVRAKKDDDKKPKKKTQRKTKRKKKE